MKLTNISTDNNFTIGCPELSPKESPRDLVGGRISLSVVNLREKEEGDMDIRREGRREGGREREGRRERGEEGGGEGEREGEGEGERGINQTPLLLMVCSWN